jgi:hypothetical protein
VGRVEGERRLPLILAAGAKKPAIILQRKAKPPAKNARWRFDPQSLRLQPLPKYITSDHRVAGSSPAGVHSEYQSRLAGDSSPQTKITEKSVSQLLATFEIQIAAGPAFSGGIGRTRIRFSRV